MSDFLLELFRTIAYTRYSMEKSLIPTNSNLPKEITLLPLEGPPLFPGMVTQMVITKQSLIEFVNYVEEKQQSFLGIIMMKDLSSSQENQNLYNVGTIAKIHKKISLQEGGYSIFLSLIERFSINKIIRKKNPIMAKVVYHFAETVQNKGKKDPEIIALTRSLISDMKEIIANNPLFSEDVRLNMVDIDHPGQIADFITSILSLKREEQQEVLETFDIRKRIIKVLTFLNKEKEMLRIQNKIQTQINDNIDKHKREYFLREMLREIKEELGEPVDGKEEEVLTFRQRLEELTIDEDTKIQIEKDIDKFEMLETNNPEHSVLSGYLEKVMSLPWKDSLPRNVSLSSTERILNRQHYGMEKVKERIIEHLAIKKIEKSEAKSILCLVGPPGVGKTSIARSIAESIGKKLYHFSVGGMRDEAEIKGHRRTYIGAMPGKIIQGLLNVRENDPVFVIDEIDKLSNSTHGDPSSALLEVLDPVQNIHFRDLYMDIPFDLSKIFFITTANTTHTIPRPLLDRMEVIELSGYIDAEKLSIAQKYIIPKSLKMHGLEKKQVLFTKESLSHISEHYAREAGMRIYEQCVNKIIRKVTTTHIRTQEDNAEKKLRSRKKYWPFTIHQSDIEMFLGLPPFRESVHNRAATPGTSVGLAWTSAGGEVLVIEAQSTKGVSRKFTLTGTLGDVMKESAQIAYTLTKNYIFQHSRELENIPADFFDTNEIHLHVPEGATPKDGPSAGITMAVALLSLASNMTIKDNFAMTGELSLVKQVLPIGGLREKIVAARRNNIKNVIIPKANLTDLAQIPLYIKRKVNIYPVSHIDEVFSLLFPKLKVMPVTGMVKKVDFKASSPSPSKKTKKKGIQK